MENDNKSSALKLISNLGNGGLTSNLNNLFLSFQTLDKRDVDEVGSSKKRDLEVKSLSVTRNTS